MCLAVPMKIMEVKEDSGILEMSGVTSEVNLSLIDTPQIGDYVIVHAGFAIERLDEEEAEKRLELFAELAKKGIE